MAYDIKAEAGAFISKPTSGLRSPARGRYTRTTSGRPSETEVERLIAAPSGFSRISVEITGLPGEREDVMRLFPGISLVMRPNRKAISYVRGGLAVWEYVLVAKGYNGDAERTAEHLHEPVERVKRALDYYGRFPPEVDERLAEMDRVADDPAAFGLTVLSF